MVYIKGQAAEDSKVHQTVGTEKQCEHFVKAV